MSDGLAQLSAEYEALIQFLYLAPVGLVQAQGDGEIAMINPIAAQLLMPHSRDGSLDNLFVALEDVAPDLRSLCQRYTAHSGKICDGLHIHLNAGDGKRMPQILSVTLLKLDASRIMAVISDITEQVRRDCRQRQNDAWLNAVLTGITDYALASLDAEGRLCEWNPSIGRVTGFGPDIEGQPYTMFYPADAITAEHAADRLREADADGWALEESRLVRADGSAFWGSVMIAPLPEADRTAVDAPARATLACGDNAAYCLILRDVSDKRDIAERRRREAYSDHLTGLANRRALFDATALELERSRAAPRPSAMIVIDADHFKAVNDRYGHAGGDAVLQHLAAILLDSVRAVDVVARIGGEEFAVLLPSTDLAQATALAGRLCARVAQDTTSFDGQAIACTISAGVAVAPDGDGGVDQLLRQADQALYAAKRHGRNRAECWRPERDAAGAPIPEATDVA